MSIIGLPTLTLGAVIAVWRAPEERVGVIKTVFAAGVLVDAGVLGATMHAVGAAGGLVGGII